MGTPIVNPFGDEPAASSPEVSASSITNPFGDEPAATAASAGASRGPSGLWEHAKAFLNEPVPNTSHLAATEQGLKNIGQGVVQGVEGVRDMFAPPKTTGEKIAAGVAGGPGLVAKRTVQSLIDTGKQAAQVPGAISDINKSPDPLGTYADAAAKTAGHGAGQAIDALATEGLVKGAGNIHDSLTGATEGRQARIAYPEAKALPDDAISGTNKIVTAAAPTGAKPNFRGKTFDAAWDMQQVAKSVQGKLEEVKGSFRTPDYRPKVTVDAINEHLHNTYQNEVVPQIESAPQQPVKLSLDPQTKAGLQYLVDNAGDEAVGALAKKALEQPTIGLSEVNDLAQQVNAELRTYEKLPASEQRKLMATDRRINGLKQADRSISAAREQTLKSIGQPGISGWEKRYAAVSNYRDQLARRINQAELQQEGLAGAIGRVAKPIRQAFGGEVNKAMAGASQSAVANVKVGKVLQNGLKQLSGAKIADPRPIGSGSGIRLPNQTPSQGFRLLHGEGTVPSPSQSNLEFGGPTQDSYGRSETFPQADNPNLDMKSPGAMPPAAQRPLSFMDSPKPTQSGAVYPGGK